MLQLKPNVMLPTVGLSGFEPPLPSDLEAIQKTVHRFAKDVLRPVGRELDRMSSEEMCAVGSPYWHVMIEAQKLGLDPSLYGAMEPSMALLAESIITEELAWGDAGLAISLIVAGFPGLVAASAGNQELVDLCVGKVGCWMITQPDRGSDVQMFYQDREMVPGSQITKANIWAKVGTDEIVINGQCSAWVSNGAVAQVALANISADYGDGFFDENGRPHGIALIIPLDLPGVAKGKPLDKIGQRALPQGEIFFDNVKVPKRFALALRDEYYGSMSSIWSYAGTTMAQAFTGVARSAFELALAYCHERKQGGQLLIDHQLTRYRLGDMLRRVELCRAVARRSLEYSRLSPSGHPYVTAMGKITVTEEAMKVAHEALQLFGANGTSREYPIEKIYRDCRSALIEDGENYMLTMRLGLLAGMLHEDGWTQN